MANVVSIIVIIFMSYTVAVQVEVVDAARLLLTFPYLLPHLQFPQPQFPQWPHMPQHPMPQLPQIPNFPSPITQLPQIPNMKFPMPQLPQTPNLYSPMPQLLQTPNLQFPMPQLPKTPTFTNNVTPSHLTAPAPTTAAAFAPAPDRTTIN
ncbi:hypothetical protein M5689_024818 [Euphorbia peplus]|nr:hypothetical protein M5689_024818 [Euphorbia peplus]